MFGRISLAKIRLFKGRNPRGYGLPSLVVVIFFVSILVQAVVNEISRDTTEARAEGAFNITKENLDTLKITGNLPVLVDQPHIPAEVRGFTTAYVGGADPRAMFSYIDNDGRAEALYEQKLRAYTNTPNDVALGFFRPGDIRREYPERILRAGDTMATDLTTENITAVGDIESGTAAAVNVTALNVAGIDSTVITAPDFITAGLQSDNIDIRGDLISDTMEITSSMVADQFSSVSLDITGSLSVTPDPTAPLADQDSALGDVILSGQLALPNGLNDPATLGFQQLIVSGVRAGEIYTGAFFATQTIGGSPEGEGFQEEEPGTTPYQSCLDGGSTVFECAQLYQPGSSDETPFQECINRGGNEINCGNLQGAPEPEVEEPVQSDYERCIEIGGSPATCNSLNGGPDYDPNTDSSTDTGGQGTTAYGNCLAVSVNPADCYGLPGTPNSTFQACMANTNDDFLACSENYISGERPITIYEVCLETLTYLECNPYYDLYQQDTVQTPYSSCSADPAATDSSCFDLTGAPDPTDPDPGADPTDPGTTDPICYGDQNQVVPCEGGEGGSSNASQRSMIPAAKGSPVAVQQCRSEGGNVYDCM